jgi:hypothetical protein
LVSFTDPNCFSELQLLDFAKCGGLMKKLFFTLILLFNYSLGWSQSDTIGGHDGGGGQGVVCYEGSEIRSVELLDFYEGRILEDYEIESFPGDYLQIYDHVTKSKSPTSRIAKFFSVAPQAVKFKFLSKGLRLNKIEDSGSFVLPVDCKIEQIANFQGVKRVFIVQDFWEKMSETDKAGLYMHEYLWFLERLKGVKKSIRVRRNVARFFSKNFNFIGDPVVGSVGDLDCVAYDKDNDYQSTQFLLSKIHGTNQCKLSFYYLNGERVFTKHESILEGCDEFIFTEPWVNFPVDIKSSFEVYDEKSRSLTHLVSLSVSSTKSSHDDESYERSYGLQVKNLEFPGLDDEKELGLLCNGGITQEDMQDVWW